MSIITRNSSVISTNSGPESKFYKIKKLVASIKEYLENPTEELTNSVSRFLQALSVTIDLTIFDPNTSIASELFVSLYELMNKGEARYPFGWYCVEALSNICRNTSARSALVHTYQFVPALSRLLKGDLTNEKKLKLLKLIQDLTCGIKISWQIPYLPYLMTTLANWIDGENEEIVNLSLGILMNLCYKNLPAIFTLNSNVNVKKLLKTCFGVGKGPILQARTYFFLHIVEQIDPGLTLPTDRFIDVTFTAIEKAFESRDYIVLRQLIQLYPDIERQLDIGDRGDNAEIHMKQVSALLKISVAKSQENNDNSFSECVSLLFQLFHHLVEQNTTCMSKMYKELISASLQWIENDTVSSYSILFLKTLAQKIAESGDLQMLTPLDSKLTEFLFTIEIGTQEDLDHNKKIAALLQLLRVMLKVETLRIRILSELKEDAMYKIFYPLLAEDSPRSKVNESSSDMFSEESINLYINAMMFLMELSRYDHKWMVIFEKFLDQKQIHFIISQALYTGSYEIKHQILEMSRSNFFPVRDVAHSMCSLQKLTSLNTVPPLKCAHASQESFSPLLALTQNGKLDFLIEKLRDASSKDLVDISTSEVMELYEYKLASMSYAERAALSDVEAASERCTQLQHRNAQLKTETDKVYQLLLHTQQKFENTLKLKLDSDKKIQELTNSLESERGRSKVFQSKVLQEEKKSKALREELEELCKKMDEMSESRNQLEEQQIKLKHLVSKLEENCSRLEKNLHKKELALTKANNEIDNLKKNVSELERDQANTQEILDKKNEELIQVKEELKVKTSIIDTITKVATSNK